MAKDSTFHWKTNLRQRKRVFNGYKSASRRTLGMRALTSEQDQPDRRSDGTTQFALAAQEDAALSGAVMRFNPPAS